MAFRCEKCGTPQEARTVPNKVVTETRDRRYEARDRDGSVLKTSFGSEIVREEDWCNPCLEEYNGWSDYGRNQDAA